MSAKLAWHKSGSSTLLRARPPSVRRARAPRHRRRISEESDAALSIASSALRTDGAATTDATYTTRARRLSGSHRSSNARGRNVFCMASPTRS